MLPPGAIPFDADFFTDLGGHSLLAARFVSVVRETPRLASITLQDLYTHRSLRALGLHLDGRAEVDETPRDLSFTPPPLMRRILCGIAQAIAMPFILAIVTSQWLGVFVSYMLITTPDATLFEEAVALLGVYMCINVATVVVSIGGKWLVLGRTRPGRYPLWGVYYYRWWLAQRLMGLTHAKWFQVSPLMRLYLAALGAKIGPDALIGEYDAGAIDLVSIGAGASLGGKLKLANARVEGNELIIGSITIGADAYIGTSCVIEENVVIADGAALEDLSSVPAGAHIGMGEIWNGSPARRTGVVNEAELDRPATASPGRRSLMAFFFTLLVLTIPPLGLLPIFPAFWVFDRLDDWMGIPASQHAYYSDGDPDLRLADRLRAGAGERRLYRLLPLDRAAAARAGGDLFRLVLVLLAQMGRRFGDGGDAGDAIVPLRHALHAHLVSPHGREDRQGFGNLHEICPAATTSSTSARNASSPMRWCSATRTCGAAGCI